MGRLISSCSGCIAPPACPALPASPSLAAAHQLLGTPDITDPRKTALLSPVGYPCFVHLPTQPFPPVHTHLDQKGKPRLKPKMQKSQLFMHPVIINKDACICPTPNSAPAFCSLGSPA